MGIKDDEIPSFPVTLIIHGEDGSTVTRWTVDNKTSTITIEKEGDKDDNI